MPPATLNDINLDDAQRWNALLQQAGIAVTAPIPEVDSFSQRGFLLRIEDLGEGIMLSDPIMVTVEFSQDGPSGYYKPLSLHTFSDTIPEIEQELKGEILDLWDWLKEADESELGQEPLEWKSHLKDIILA